jgi:NADH:ubiquinone oxidoreductase subunit 5 (subunit L)/multisubunit Na+/H+ antiporter MnhA subunit
MEGPTPVSALIHAATMVTAGIFLLIRCSFIFDSSEEMQLVITIVGGCTAFLSACTALFLYDIKKIIAYSTCSQLGYMAVACGLSQYQVGLFHLINHAFFKALIFLAAGAIIHSFSNEQDIRRLSGVATRMPFLWIILLIGNFAIMGIPFFSGFYSKDIIIEISFLTHSFDIGNFNVLYLLIMLATCCTGIYSVRISYYLFFRNLYKGVAKTTLNQPFFLQVVLSLLLVGSIVSGYILAELMSPTYFLFKGGLQNFIAGENEFLP